MHLYVVWNLVLIRPPLKRQCPKPIAFDLKHLHVLNLPASTYVTLHVTISHHHQGIRDCFVQGGPRTGGMKATDVPGLKVTELRDALRARGLSTAGTKAILAERLLAALAEANEEGTEGEPRTDKPDACKDGGGPITQEQDTQDTQQSMGMSDANPPKDEKPAIPTGEGPAAASDAAAPGNKPETYDKSSVDEVMADAQPKAAQVAAEAKAEVRAAGDASAVGDDSDMAMKSTEKPPAAAETVVAEPTGTHSNEHEEQVDYGTDDITGVEEPAEEAAAEAPKPSQEGPIAAATGADAAGVQSEPPESAASQPQTERPEAATAADSGATPSKASQARDEVMTEAVDAAPRTTTSGTGAEAEALELQPSTTPSASKRRTPAAAKRPSDAAEKVTVGGGAGGPAAAAVTAPPESSAPALAGGGSGRKRQPIEFKADEVQQRVAAKRAARESTTVEAAGKEKVAAAPAATAAAKPVAAGKLAAKQVLPGGGAEEGSDVKATTTVVADTKAAPTSTAAAPAGEMEHGDAQAAPTGPNEVESEGAGQAAAGRAVKLQKLDVAGRKATGAALAATVLPRAPMQLATGPAAVKPAGAAVVGPPAAVPIAAAKKPPPAPLQGPVTRALRIDGFVRPLTERSLREMLSQYGTIEDLWMPSIKKFCYVVFAEEAQGEAAATATNGAVWPPGNPTSILKPVYVTLEDAATAITNGRSGVSDAARGAAGQLRSSNGSVPAVGGSTVSPKGGLATAGSSGGPRRDSLSAAIAAAAADAAAAKLKAAPGAAAAAAAAAAAVAGRKRTEPEADTAAAAPEPPAADSPEADVAVLEVPPINAVDSAPVTVTRPAEPQMLSLDDLFKKTKTKPVIYWLPLTEEAAAAARKKRHEEEAAAAEAAADADRQQDRQREAERARERGPGGHGALPPPPPLPLPPPPQRDARGVYDRDRGWQRPGYGRDRR